VATSVLWSSWLALLLAEAGRFSLITAAAVTATACLLALLLGRKHLSAPLVRPARARELVPVGLVLAVSLALHAHPSEYIFGGRDPGTYVNAMALISRTGAIAVTNQVVRSIPAQDTALFYLNPENPGLFMGFPMETIESGRVIPELLHLFPAFGAYLHQAMGTRGALATPPVFGVLGTLAVFFALRRLFSDGVALLAALLLAVNVLQVWFARFPASEPMSQFLIFTGLLALTWWEETGSKVYGALAGVAFGVSLLVRIDSALIVVPLAAYLIVRRARRELEWREALPLLGGFTLLGLHCAVHAAFWSRKYVASILDRPYWSYPGWVWVGAALLVVAGGVLSERFGPRIAHRLGASPRRLQAALGVVLLAVSTYAYAVRPALAAWAGSDRDPAPTAGVALFHALDRDGNDVLAGPEMEAAVAQLGPPIVRAIDGNHDGRILRSEWHSGPPRWPWLAGYRRVAAHDAEAFVRFGWFVGRLGLVLGLAGFLLALRDWRGRYLFFALLSVTFAAFYFYKMRVWNDYYFAMRRVVPVILPAFLAWGAHGIVALLRRPGVPRAAGAALGLVLSASYVIDTRRIVGHKEWDGAVRFVEDVSRHFQPEDVVIFEQVASLHLLSLPLWAQHGVNVLQLARYKPEPPEALHHLIEAWRGRYKNIYFVHTPRTDLCDLFLEPVASGLFVSRFWEQPKNRAPEKAEDYSMSFRISRLTAPQDLNVPPLAEVDIGGSDDVQVSGFFDKEGAEGETFRWTGACASIYVPGARAGADLVVRASAGRRPVGDVPSVADPGHLVRVAPADVKVSMNGVPIGAFTAVDGLQEYRLPLPPVLPAGAPVLRFDVKAWRPVNVIPGSTDIRELGVMIERVRVAPLG
jgi:hypothetical protein